MITLTEIPNSTDTGWQNLLGFDYVAVGPKPQVRRIGKVLYFRGGVTIPLSDNGGSNLIPFGGTYRTNYYKDPWTGTSGTYGNGVTLNSSGGVFFNANTPVIPTSVLPLATPLDDTYRITNVIAYRQLETLATWGTALSSVFNIIIFSDKRMFVQLLKDTEQLSGFLFYQKSCPTRFIISNVRAGDYIPDYANGLTNIQNNPTGSSLYNLVSESYYPPVPGAATYPYTCDASLETDVGGFGFFLDGLTAFIP